MSWNWTIHHWIHFHFGWINHLLEKSKTIHCCATNHWGLIHCAYWLYQTLHEVLENAISNISKTFSHIQDTPTPPKAIQQKKWCDLSLWRIHHRQQIKTHQDSTSLRQKTHSKTSLMVPHDTHQTHTLWFSHQTLAKGNAQKMVYADQKHKSKWNTRDHHKLTSWTCKSVDKGGCWHYMVPYDIILDNIMFIRKRSIEKTDESNSLSAGTNRNWNVTSAEE